MKAGSIIPEYYDIRENGVKSLWEIKKRDSQQIRLWVYPDENGDAEGYYYQDDGFTFDYTKRMYNLYKFYFSSDGEKAEFSIELLHNEYKGQKTNFVVRAVSSENDVAVDFDGTSKVVIDFEI